MFCWALLPENRDWEAYGKQRDAFYISFSLCWEWVEHILIRVWVGLEVHTPDIKWSLSTDLRQCRRKQGRGCLSPNRSFREATCFDDAMGGALPRGYGCLSAFRCVVTLIRCSPTAALGLPQGDQRQIMKVRYLPSFVLCPLPNAAGSAPAGPLGKIWNFFRSLSRDPVPRIWGRCFGIRPFRHGFPWAVMTLEVSDDHPFQGIYF